MEQNMTSIRIVAAALVACFAGAPALAQGTKVAIGTSGWTGFAPSSATALTNAAIGVTLQA